MCLRGERRDAFKLQKYRPLKVLKKSGSIYVDARVYIFKGTETQIPVTRDVFLHTNTYRSGTQVHTGRQAHMQLHARKRKHIDKYTHIHTYTQTQLSRSTSPLCLSLSISPFLSLPHLSLSLMHENLHILKYPTHEVRN